jgi:hypothetical protein
LLEAAAQKKREGNMESQPDEKNLYSDHSEDFVLINHRNSSSQGSGQIKDF